jgi:hypothetical protein
MKRTLVCIAGVCCLLLAVLSYANDKPATEINQKSVLKTANVKMAKMNARGKVVEISDTAVKIERSIKDNVEIMEFTLENPAQDVVVNDYVKIVYSVKDGKLTASRVVKSGSRKHPGKSGTKQTKEKPASAAK